MLLVALLLLSANLNMPKTVGSTDKIPGARKSRAGADQARLRDKAAKSAGGRSDIRGAFARGGSAPTLAPAPAPETIAPVPGSSGTGDGEAAVPPPQVIDDANDALADAFAPGQQGPRHPNSVHLTTAAAALVNDDAVAASARRAAVASDISTPYDAAPFHRVEPATTVAAAPNAAPPPEMQEAPRESGTRVTVALTMANIQSIFNEQPLVRHKYLECVPLLMSEKEFWQRYFRAKTRAGAPPVLPAATAGASVAAATGASATATVGVDAEGGLAVSESAPLRGATKPLDPPQASASAC